MGHAGCIPSTIVAVLVEFLRASTGSDKVSLVSHRELRQLVFGVVAP